MKLPHFVWGVLVGGGAVGLPVAAGMVLIQDAHPDAWDMILALIAVAIGALVAGLWALRRGPMNEGRAATLGCLAWMLVSLLGFMAVNPFYGIAWVLVGALPAAVFGMGMGVLLHWMVDPCIRKL